MEREGSSNSTLTNIYDYMAAASRQPPIRSWLLAPRKKWFLDLMIVSTPNSQNILNLDRTGVSTPPQNCSIVRLLLRLGMIHHARLRNLPNAPFLGPCPLHYFFVTELTSLLGVMPT
jgi:hypothetical protein